MSCKRMPKTDRLLETNQLLFAVQNKILLKNINLNLPQGKITMLLGPNGAGKSTLLRLLSGYLPATSGDCYFQGKLLSQFAPMALAHQRAVMGQHSLLNFPFATEEIIRMGGYHRRKKDVEQFLPEVIEATDCTALCQRSYQQLSGGEKQRVQLARCLLQLWQTEMSGKLLFLDEPTSALDLYHQQHCLRLLNTLCATKGLTVCCILHDLNLASLYGDHFILLAEHTIQAQGTAEAILVPQQLKRWYKADISLHRHHQTSKPQIAFNR